MTGVFEDHLAVDAIVAYVDGELSLLAFQRAAAHLSRCPSCAAEVAEQATVQQCLRSAAMPAMPGALFDSLRSIPLALPAAPVMAAPPRRDPLAERGHRLFRFGG